MTPPPTTSELTSAIGFFLTLTGLLSTFFYVHLSNWFREILELNSKYDENKTGEDERRRNARVECKYQLKRFFNHVPLLVSGVITAFIVVNTIQAFNMISAISPRPVIFGYYAIAFWIFLIAYFVLTFYFLIHGYVICFRLRSQLWPSPKPGK